MIRDSISLLRYEAKRHPELAELMANINSMSEQEINNAKVKLPWIRQALLQLKGQSGYDNLAAFMEKLIVDGHNPDPVGETRQWTGDNTFILMGKNQIEIRTGQLVWFGKGVWLDTIHSERLDPRLISHTQSCGSMTRSAYMQMIRDRARASDGPMTVVGGSKPAFTIYRV